MFFPGLQVLLFLLTAAETFEVSLRTHPAFGSPVSEHLHLFMSCVLSLLDVHLQCSFRNALWPPATIYKVLPNSCFCQHGKSRGWFASSVRGAVVCNCAAIVDTSKPFLRE
ncbi:hypothetical protein ATANTOWER_014468 [Ataeniobius toweri]|uniref:Secreted protein n=1 Tax=Ataeniobius toweri TaxID=208326 RepID=A0ABU7CHK6_9TELE|nr:hypothetical protein [Ataeniobius toweri]